MRDYIESFEKILPDAQRSRIISEIKRFDKTQDNITTGEYEDYINKIVEERDVASSFTPMNEDRLSSGLYNSFIQNASIDLNVLYNENDLLERAINNYIYATQSTVTEIKHYMEELKTKISQLRYDDRASSSTISYIENFKSLDHIQLKSAQNASDFLDRDGTALVDCQFNTAAGYTTLNVKSGIDAILNTRTTINLVDRVGAPTNENLFPIGNAIDRDYTTFWGNIMLSSDALDIPVTVAAEANTPTLVFRNGSIIVFDITFTQKQFINKISMQFFEEFPTIVERILYKQNGTPQESFAQLTKEPKTSTGHITTFIFQPVNAKVLRIVLRQPNHKRHEYTVFKSDENNSALIKNLIDLDIQKSLKGDFTGLSISEQNAITGTETFKSNYQEFLKKYNAFKDLLKRDGFNWTDAQIKEYIKTGRRP